MLTYVLLEMYYIQHFHVIWYTMHRNQILKGIQIAAVQQWNSPESSYQPKMMPGRWAQEYHTQSVQYVYQWRSRSGQRCHFFIILYKYMLHLGHPVWMTEMIQMKLMILKLSVHDQVWVTTVKYPLSCHLRIFILKHTASLQVWIQEPISHTL